MKNEIEIIGGIVGTIGGTLGIVSWIQTRTQSHRYFNQITYSNHLKHKYKLCFENTRCPETDNVNMYYLWDLIDNIREFKKHENKFKGLKTSSCFNDVFIYSDVIKFDHWTPLNWFNYDTEVNNEHTINDYNEKKTHIERLKPFFKEFYISVFENID
ncbi:MAG: hypothetical protein JNJ40_19650 [Bacteroidia bacterium]|nr:hypothetical protein [Bacteroidia bacterium]